MKLLNHLRVGMATQTWRSLCTLMLLCFFFCFSLRFGIKEDEEDMRMEEEEMKRKQAMKAKRKKT